MSACLQIACIKGANVYTVYIYMCVKTKLKTLPIQLKAYDHMTYVTVSILKTTSIL